MASGFSGAVRLVLGLGLGLALFQACGGLKAGTVNLIPGDGSGGSSNLANAGQAGASVAASGGAAGESGSEPIGGAGAECVAGRACASGLEGAICVAGACSACAGVKDDPKCVRAYGKGFLCIDGGCVKADCHADTDCGVGSCVGHHCTPCAADVDCPTPNTICNVSTGACVTNVSCGNAGVGAACPVNPNDKCCGVGGVCVAVQCCGVAACKTSPSAATNDGTCKNGECVAQGCSAPPPSLRFVDFNGVAGGSGSKDCPFNTLAAALQDLAAAGGQIIIKSGSTVTVDFTAALGAGITLTGADATFAACTKDTCADPTKWPLITTGNHRAFSMITPGNRSLRFVRLAGLDPAQKLDATTSGIYVATASLTVDHTDISGYQFGIYADTASSVKVDDGARFHGNRTGLYVSDGNGAAGGTVAITATAEPISFDHNGLGLQCHGNGVLKISGPPAGPKLTSLISVNDNDAAGLYLSVLNTQASIDGVECANNGQDPTSGNLDGAAVFAHSNVKFRNCYFHDNKGNGIHVPVNGANSTDGLSQIDLGINLAAGAGHNTFIANAAAGICVAATTANAADKLSLKAQGNVFRASGGDCTKAGTVVTAAACSGGVDVAADCAGSVDFAGCSGNVCQ